MPSHQDVEQFIWKHWRHCSMFSVPRVWKSQTNLQMDESAHLDSLVLPSVKTDHEVTQALDVKEDCGNATQ